MELVIGKIILLAQIQLELTNEAKEKDENAQSESQENEEHLNPFYKRFIESQKQHH